jgi:hypothetical protein
MSKSYHIKFVVTIAVANDNKIAITRTNNNLTTNNNTIINIGIKITTIDFVFNV